MVTVPMVSAVKWLATHTVICVAVVVAPWGLPNSLPGLPDEVVDPMGGDVTLELGEARRGIGPVEAPTAITRASSASW